MNLWFIWTIYTVTIARQTCTRKKPTTNGNNFVVSDELVILIWTIYTASRLVHEILDERKQCIVVSDELVIYLNDQHSYNFEIRTRRTPGYRSNSKLDMSKTDSEYYSEGSLESVGDNLLKIVPVRFVFQCCVRVQMFKSESESDSWPQSPSPSQKKNSSPSHESSSPHIWYFLYLPKHENKIRTTTVENAQHGTAATAWTRAWLGPSHESRFLSPSPSPSQSKKKLDSRPSPYSSHTALLYTSSD